MKLKTRKRFYRARSQRLGSAHWPCWRRTFHFWMPMGCTKCSRCPNGLSCWTSHKSPYRSLDHVTSPTILGWSHGALQTKMRKSQLDEADHLRSRESGSSILRHCHSNPESEHLGVQVCLPPWLQRPVQLTSLDHGRNAPDICNSRCRIYTINDGRNTIAIHLLRFVATGRAICELFCDRRACFSIVTSFGITVSILR